MTSDFNYPCMNDTYLHILAACVRRLDFFPSEASKALVQMLRASAKYKAPEQQPTQELDILNRLRKKFF